MNRLYGWTMQNVFLPLMLAPTRSKTTQLTRQIRKNQWLPLGQLHTLQLIKLRKLVELATRESPFYRQRFATLGLSVADLHSLADLQKFPITGKEDIEANFPEGMVIAGRRNSDWQYVGTRGTTRRVMVVHDFERRDVERAAIMVTLTEDSPYRYGAGQVTIPPDACSVHCGLEGARAASVSEHLWSIATGKIKRNREAMSDLRGIVMDTWVQPNCVLPPLALTGENDNYMEVTAAIRQHKPCLLMALPEYLRALAQHIIRTGDNVPPIPVIRPMGANLPASWKGEISSAFGGQVREHYGSREMGPMAFDCRHVVGLHTLMDLHIIEIVRDGQHVAEGELGKVLVTDLNNFAMPIIRYDIGDLARMTSERCPCGRNTSRLTMEGRVEDAVITEQGRILTAEAIANFFAVQENVDDFELSVDRRGNWQLRIVPQHGRSIDESAIARQFAEWSGRQGPLNVRLSITIKPESSGKFRHIKNQTYGTSASPDNNQSFASVWPRQK